jgi:hypothetical protein
LAPDPVTDATGKGCFSPSGLLHSGMNQHRPQVLTARQTMWGHRPSISQVPSGLRLLCVISTMLHRLLQIDPLRNGCPIDDLTPKDRFPVGRMFASISVKGRWLTVVDLDGPVGFNGLREVDIHRV